jgi:hypothetical protein
MRTRGKQNEPFRPPIPFQKGEERPTLNPASGAIMSVSLRRVSLFHIADVLISAASPHRVNITLPALVAALAAMGCQDSPTAPSELSAPAIAATYRAESPEKADDADEANKPNFNLNVVLRGEGSGRIKFRQPKSDGTTHMVNLDIKVRHLQPNTSYLLQRAVDTILDGNCTSTAWLTLGKGSAPQAITTDARGKGHEQLFRVFPASLVGSTFDIHFRVIRQDNSAVVLTSECYQFTVR